MAEERLEQAARDVAAGIDGDPELRLEAQADTLAWLEAAAAEATQDGLSEADAATRALDALGPVRARRDELAASYEPRRRRRATAGLLFLGLTLLATILAVIAAPFGMRLWSYDIPRAYWFSTAWMTGPQTRFSAAHQPKYGFSSDPKPWRELWRTQPENIAYLANYAKRSTSEADLYEYLRRDANNAHPYYLLATREYNQAIKPVAIDQTSLPTTDPFWQTFAGNYTVIDHAQLDRAMRHLRDGMAQRRLNSYTYAMEQERLRLLPTPDRYDSYWLRTEAAYVSNDRMTDRQLQAAYYAHLLVQEGRAREAEPYLRFWRVYCRQVVDNAETLLDLHTAARAASDGARYTAFVYREMGQEAAARRDEQDARRLAEILAIGGENTDGYAYLRQTGGLLAAAHLIRIARRAEVVSPEELRPAREVGYLMREQHVLGLVLMAAAAVAVGMALLQYLFVLMACHERLPLVRLFMPAWVWLALLGCGVVVPLGIYYWVTRVSGLVPRIVTENLMETPMPRLVLLPACCLLAVLLGAAWWSQRRWQALGLPRPAKRPAARVLLFLGIAVGFVLAAIANAFHFNETQLSAVYFGLALLCFGAMFRHPGVTRLAAFCASLLIVLCVFTPYFTQSDFGNPLWMGLLLVLLYAPLGWRFGVRAVGLLIVVLLVPYLFIHLDGWTTFLDFVQNDAVAGYIIVAAVALAPIFLLVRWRPNPPTVEGVPSIAPAVYFGTLLRTIQPVFSAAMLLLLLAGAWLVSQEIAWCQRDTVLLPKGATLEAPAYHRVFVPLKAEVLRMTAGWDDLPTP